MQSNFGGVLTMDGAPVGKELGRCTPRRTRERGDGSCMIVVATDAPLDARDLKRLAARAVFGLARTGSSFSNGSGDFAIAFSTVRPRRGANGLLTYDARANGLPLAAIRDGFRGDGGGGLQLAAARDNGGVALGEG